MPTTTVPTNQTEIISRALDEQCEAFSPEAARFFLSLSLTPADRERMDQLAEKARLGDLTPQESIEIEEYRRCVRLMDLMKLRARHALQRAA